MTDLQTFQAELRQLVEARKDDPAFADLLEVLVEECKRLFSVRFDSRGVAHHMESCLCGGAGFVPRTWKGQPDGAYRGALLAAARKAGLRFGLYTTEHILYYATDEEATQLVIEKMEKLDTKKEEASCRKSQ